MRSRADFSEPFGVVQSGVLTGSIGGSNTRSWERVNGFAVFLRG